jgi:hypothetical protein
MVDAHTLSEKLIEFVGTADQLADFGLFYITHLYR